MQAQTGMSEIFTHEGLLDMEMAERIIEEKRDRVQFRILYFIISLTRVNNAE